jgi:protein regulator of cytokinesis 1
VTSGRGVVTPAVRPGSAMGGTSNKRQKVADGAGGRTVLGSHRGNKNGNGHRVVSPTKASTKTPGRSLPRAALRSVSMHMPIPKLGTQHHALGHGRVPSGMPLGMSTRNLSSSTTSRGYGAKTPVDSKKARSGKRESFKPRPSVDDWQQHGHGGRWGGYAGPSVKEEDERY